MIIEAKLVSKVYLDVHAVVKALEKVSIGVREAEYVAIVGPSGAGKSTLLHILGGLERPTEGKVFFRKKDISRMKASSIYRLRNEHLGFVFQFYYLISELNVWENILLPASIKLHYLPQKTRDYAGELAEMLGLKERIHAFPHQLSGGERQRVALARALINRPQILFCDEPTGNLDTEAAAIIKQVLRDINCKNSTTIVLVTHNLDLAREAERIIYLNNGRIENESSA